MKKPTRPLFFFLAFFLITTITKAQLFPTPERLSVLLEESVYKITTADLNGDSLKDVIVSAAQPDVYWFQNLGQSAFGFEQEIYEGSVFGESAEALDVDGDSDMDIISGESFASEIVWIENNGDGTFGEGTLITGSLRPIDDLVLVDFDNDNRKDILYAVYSATDKAGGVYWIRNNGQGNFSGPRTITSEAHEVKKLAYADLDNDGFVDVIAGSYWDFRLNWFKNMGNGSFSNAKVIRSTQDSIRNSCVFAADMDGDGDIDIINGKERTPRVVWYENDGQGIFTQVHTIYSDNFVWDIDAADFDLDGDMDLFTGLGNEEEVGLFLNTGNGVFGNPIIVANNIRVLNDIHLVDIDNDWDLDVFAASTLDHNVWFFENHRIDCVPIEVHQDVFFCAGETISIGQLDISSPGEFVIALSPGLVCDTVLILNVTRYDTYAEEVFDTITNGTVYTLPSGDQVSISGSYSSILESVAGCDSTIVVHLFVDGTISTKGPLDHLEYAIYPDLNAGTITVEVTAEFEYGMMIYFSNSLGQRIKEVILYDTVTTFPVSFTAGSYFVTFETSRGMLTKKIMFMK